MVEDPGAPVSFGVDIAGRQPLERFIMNGKSHETGAC